MNTFAVLLTFVLAILVLLLSISFIEVEGSNGGNFGIELIHRESPLSPFYNDSETTSDRFQKSVLRSLSRINSISLASTVLDTNIVTDVIPNGGDYLMKLSIGTPPVEVLAIADTGSDLIWTQCKPCTKCYKQDPPLFDPKLSSTYREISCNTSFCQTFGNKKCDSNGSCGYSYSYGDKSTTNGTFAAEAFTFDSTNKSTSPNVLIPTLVFGCGHENAGKFSSHGSGLVGLGGGPLSLVSQLSSKIDGKFSYCLVDVSVKSTSKLNFGSQAIISGNNVVSTPLVTKFPATYYYLTLEAISVGGQRLENKPMNNSSSSSSQQSNSSTAGNIIIDSGTTLTMLPMDLYNQLESTVRKLIIPASLVPIKEPSGTFSLCYSAKSTFQIPEMIFHFTGADVRLMGLNIFQRISNDLVCLTMVPTQFKSIPPIYGNLAQINFLIEYDLVGKKVSFAQTDCTKH